MKQQWFAMMFLVMALPTLLLFGVPTGAEDKVVGPDRNTEALPPAEPPAQGPGSARYAHEKVEVTERGQGAERYWVYTPAEPKPESAPVVVFLHGFGQMTPENYVGWLYHICRRGHVVIYPQYQATIFEDPADYAPNSAIAVRNALDWLEQDESRVQPKRDQFALVGHSAGGMTAANMAADWERLKLPRPRAVMPVQPGRSFAPRPQAQANGLIPLSNFRKIPEDCLLLCLYSDSDHVVGAWCARTIFMGAESVKAENKNLVRLMSCDYGASPVIAWHHTPTARLDSGVDLWDWYAYWKLFDGLCDAAFRGKHREYALGDTPRQRYMGKYSDGRPFAELKVWLGDAKVDPDEDYVSVFNRNGKRVERE